MAPDSWTQALEQGWRRSRTLLLLAATDTAAVPGISAAGASPQARLGTAAADAELLLLGPGGRRCHALPPLPAGVSPALISNVVLSQLGLLERTRVLDLGCAIAAAVPHLRLPGLESAGPARCLSTGQALAPARVAALVQRGSAWGRRWDPAEPLLLAECVPGGTTTALAVLEGLGVAAAGLVSGSLRQPAHGLKSALVAQGLAAAGFETAELAAVADPLSVLAALGDPMQAFAAGLVGAAAARGTPVLLAGGSAWGLDAAAGVMRWLEEHGHGYRVPYGLVPIVPAAVLFDLAVGDHRIRPDARAGYAACVAASENLPKSPAAGS